MRAEVGALWCRSTGRSRPALRPAAAEPEHSGAVDPPEVERDPRTFDLRRGAESARAPSSGAQLLFGFISVLMVWIRSSEEPTMQRDTVCVCV